jgi:hypothetical protein
MATTQKRTLLLLLQPKKKVDQRVGAIFVLFLVVFVSIVGIVLRFVAGSLVRVLL